MERRWQTIDKTGWGPGPWSDEPDKIQWVDLVTDLDCLIVRGPMGSLCGYVGLPPGHPLHGSHYEAPDVDVHGGLTFADRCMEDLPEGQGVCHIPAPGRPADVWWLGFDCGHFMDTSPGLEARMRAAGIPSNEDIAAPFTPTYAAGMFTPTYKPVAYVHREVTGLAEQLAQRRLTPPGAAPTADEAQ